MFATTMENYKQNQNALLNQMMQLLMMRKKLGQSGQQGVTPGVRSMTNLQGSPTGPYGPGGQGGPGGLFLENQLNAILRR